MRKAIYTKILITLLLYIFILKPFPVYAWDDCPKGIVNDPYPGDCARYIDTDNNGICDHSEPAPEDRVKEVREISSVSEKAQLAATNTAPTSNLNPSNASPSKPFLAFSIVVSHLAGILIYVSYKKARLRKS